MFGASAIKYGEHMAMGGKVQCVSGSYQNYQNGAVSNQLADGEGANVLGVNMNLLMCTEYGGTLYSVQATVS